MCLEEENQVDSCYWKLSCGGFLSFFFFPFSKITSWKTQGDALKAERSGAVNELRKKGIQLVPMFAAI